MYESFFSLISILRLRSFYCLGLGRGSDVRNEKNVTSKGGTTEAALKVFDEAKLAEHFARAVAAASKRGEEMGREFGGD